MINPKISKAIAQLSQPEHKWHIIDQYGYKLAGARIEVPPPHDFALPESAPIYFDANNWNDLIPLVVANEITYVRTSGNQAPYWVATHRSHICVAVEAEDLSEAELKRILAIAVLKVLEKKDG